jgi:hypothetical protein
MAENALKIVTNDFPLLTRCSAAFGLGSDFNQERLALHVSSHGLIIGAQMDRSGPAQTVNGSEVAIALQAVRLVGDHTDIARQIALMRIDPVQGW